MNIIDLGLVYGLRIDQTNVEVKLTLTVPDCRMGEEMVKEVKDNLRQLPGVEDVAVKLVFDPPWAPDMMSGRARRELGWQTA